MKAAWLWASLALGAAALKKSPANRMKLPSFRGVAEVRASIPGRLRLHMPAIAQNPDAAREMKARLETTGAVTRVELNPVTSTALILYDENQVSAAVIEGAAIKLMGLDRAALKQPQSLVEKGLDTLYESVNHGVMEATGGLFDVRTLTGSALTVAALWRLATAGAVMPGALTLLWWASNIFKRGPRNA